MLPVNSLFATVYSGSRRYHRLFHHRLLQHPKRCTYHYHYRPNGGRDAALPLSQSKSTPLARAHSNFIRDHSCINQSSSTCNNPHAAKDKEKRHCHDNHPEPEYLELVTHTADKMRSAVRDYVTDYSREYDSDTAHEKVGIIKDNEPSEHRSPPIKLVGILATTTTHPISTSESSDDNDNYGNETYSEQIANCCLADGIMYEPWRVPPTLEALERAIHHANERLDFGILSSL